MKIFNIPSLRLSAVSATVLGLASIIRSASAIDDPQKPEVPSVPKSAQINKEEKTNKSLDIDHVTLAYEVLEPLSREERIKFAKKIFTETKNALVNNTADLKTQEKSLMLLLNAISSNYKSLKDILPVCKNEYQELIGVYIDALSNPEHKREQNRELGARWNAFILANLLANRGDMKIHTVPQLFNEKWYTKIEKVIDRIDKEFKLTPGSKLREHSIFAVARLAKLELKKDSGIKTPKVYFSLLNILDKNIDQNWTDIAPAIKNCVLDEAFMNDSPPGSRIIKHEGNIVRIKVNDSLTNPLEKILSRVLSKLPDNGATEANKKRYKETFDIARTFFKHNDNPECVIAWQSPILDKIAKSKPDDIPELLSDFRNACDKTWGELNPSYDKHREIYQAGGKYFKPILEIGCKHLLDKNPTNNLIGSLIVRGVKNAYSDYGPTNFSKDIEVKRLFLQVLTRMQKEELKANNAFVKYLHSTIDFLHLTWNDPDIVKEAALSLTVQVNYAHKAKNNGLDKKWVESQEVALLNATNEFVGWMWSTYGTRFDNETIAKNIDPLYRSIGENIVKENPNLATLNEGRKLVKYLYRFRRNEKPEGEVARKFVQETIIDLLFKNILDSSAKLPPLERKNFLNILQKEDLSWFLGWIDREDLTAATKTLQLFSKHYFSSKEEKSLEHFSKFIKSKIDPHNFNRWHPVAVCEVLDLNREYLKTIVKESIKNIESNKKDKELVELEYLTAYLESLKYSQDSLKDSRANFYPKEKSHEVEAFIKDSAKSCNGLFLNRLQNEKVIVERSDTDGEHTVYDKGFELTIKGLKDITSIHPAYLPECINILNKRLDTEKDSRTRGMLYKASSTISFKDNVILSNFRKAIVKEKSPLTSEKIGEAIADRFIDEFVEGKSREYILRGYSNYHNGPRYTEIEKLNLDKKMKNFNERLQKVIEKGIIEPNEKTPAQDFLLTCVLYSRGSNIEPLLKDNLSKDLLKKLSSRSNKDLDPEIIKAAHIVLNNSNSILSAFGSELNKETKYIVRNYHDEESAGWTRGLKDLLIVNLEIKKASSQITKLLESNLRRSPIGNLPSISASLLEFYGGQDQSLVGYNKKVDHLAESLFKGTNEKLSIFELYESSLQSRFLWQHLENCRNDRKHFNKESLKGIEITCYALIKRLENIYLLKDVNSRKSKRIELGLEISKLEPQLFLQAVTTPLQNARLKFIEGFIVRAPSRQRREYIDIILNRFGLREQVPELELKRILEE